MHRPGINKGSFEEDERMDTFEEDIRWFYKDEFGVWHMFDVYPSDQCPLTNREIEVKHSRNWNGFLEYGIADCTYRLDFSAMKQINVTTGKKRPIRRGYQSTTGHRSPNGKQALPVHLLWETDLPFQLIELDSGTQECQNVLNEFAKTMPDVLIRSIKRIQNLNLWESFCRKRAQLTQAKQMPIEEQMLFHGTLHKNIRPICTSNFDLKFAGKNGSACGKGIYFARHARYSLSFCGDQVSRNGISPSQTVILARVMVGEFTLGQIGFAQAPSKDVTNTSFYDSCVDRFSHPNIFVVFDSNQIYPEYLIEF